LPFSISASTIPVFLTSEQPGINNETVEKMHKIIIKYTEVIFLFIFQPAIIKIINASSGCRY